MNDDKQLNPEVEHSVHYGTGKKINRDACPVPNERSEFWCGVLKWVIIGLAGFVVVVLIFGAGMFVGGMKAQFSYRWAESYHKNFGGPRAGFLGDWQKLPIPPGDFIEAHGAFGEIIKLNDTGFVIKGRGDVEKLIIITADTVIKKGTDTVKAEELKVGDRIVIIGSPNEEGQIEAKLIRVFDGKDMKTLRKPSWFPFFR